jgi:hypothetical protein
MVCLMERGFTKGENVTIQHLAVPLCWDRPFDSALRASSLNSSQERKSNTSRHHDFIIISTTDFELTTVLDEALRMQATFTLQDTGRFIILDTRGPCSLCVPGRRQHPLKRGSVQLPWQQVCGLSLCRRFTPSSKRAGLTVASL